MRAHEFLIENTVLNEVPLPPDWDPRKMSANRSFDDRLHYALKRAQEIGAGSSRVAMIIEYEGRPTVLKVARSEQGLVQNEQEIEVLKNSRVSKMPIVIPMIDYDKANKRPVWIQTELAKKVKESTLNKIFRTPSLRFLIEFVDFKSGKSSYFFWHDFETTSFSEIKEAYLGNKFLKLENTKYTEKDWEIFTGYVDQLVHLVYNTKLETGDFEFDENWGLYNGNPVIIDLGFTQTTREYY